MGYKINIETRFWRKDEEWQRKVYILNRVYVILWLGSIAYLIWTARSWWLFIVPVMMFGFHLIVHNSYLKYDGERYKDDRKRSN